MRKLLLALLLTVPAFAQTNPVTAAFPGAVVTDDQLTYQDDFGSTTLSASVGASDLTIFITSAAGFLEPSVISVCPVGECSSGNYANAELMMVTGISGTTLTIASTGRELGQDCIGSATGKTFAIGSVVELVPSSCAHNRLAAEVKAIETALGANLANVVEAADFDTEAELETLLTDVTNLIVSTEIDTVAELEALAGAVNLIASTEVDTIAELEALLGAVNVLLSTEIDTSAEVAAVLGDETGTGSVVFNIAPNLQGVIDGTGTAVDDDDCTGQQGEYWFDSTDGQFEFCNANTGAPSVPGTGGGGGGAPTDVTYLVSSSDVTLTNEVVVNDEATLESALGAIDVVVSTEVDTQAEAEALFNADFEADDLSDDDAGDLPFTPAGTIAATDVQAAIEEVASEAGGSGSSINVEENNTEVISSANLTGIDFLGADFDVTDDTNEANVAVAAAIARDSEVTSAVNAAVSGTANFLAYFNGTNSVISSSIGVAANTITLPVTTGQLIFGDGDTYLYENTDDSVRWRTGGTDRFFITDTSVTSLTTGAFALRTPAGGVSAATYGFAGDIDNGLYYIGTNNWAASAAGTKIIDYQTAQVGYLTTLGFFSAAAPTTDAAGEAGFDNNAWAASRGALAVFDGTAITNLVGTLASDTPTNGQVPKWNTGGTITWEDDTTGGGGALNDLTDVDTTGQTTGDFLGYDGTDWGPAEVATPDNTIALENKTIDGGAPRTTTTTLPTGANEMPMCRHEDDVTSLTGVADGVACFEEDSNIVYVCESPEGIAGVCDAAGEWTAQSAAASEVNDLEGDGASGIATTEIPIGTGAGTVAYAALSGDATMTNAGVVTVANDSHTHGASTLGTDSVSADELNATGVEAELEAVLEVDSLQGNLGVAHLNSGTSASSSTFWRGDGTWATPAGGGSSTEYEVYPLASEEGSASTTGAGVALGTTGGCTISHNLGVNSYIACDATADEAWTFEWMIPPNWDGTNLDIHLANEWGSSTGTINMSVAIACQSSDGSEVMPSPNSPDALQFTAPATANGKMTRLEITAPTLTGCAAGDKMSMLWLRDADHGSEDTYTLDTKFTHLMIEWGTS